MNRKGYIGKLKVVSLNLSVGTAEKYENYTQSNWSPDLDLSPGPLEYHFRILTKCSRFTYFRTNLEVNGFKTCNHISHIKYYIFRIVVLVFLTFGVYYYDRIFFIFHKIFLSCFSDTLVYIIVLYKFWLLMN
jgi:hypothetical protein